VKFVMKGGVVVKAALHLNIEDSQPRGLKPSKK